MSELLSSACSATLASLSLFWRRKGKRGQHVRIFKTPPFIDGQRDELGRKTLTRVLGYRLSEQNNSVWPNPKHWLRKLQQQLHPQAKYCNKYSDRHHVGPYPSVYNGYSNVCQWLSVNIYGQLTSNRLRETPFTSFPMSDAGYTDSMNLVRRSKMQIRALFLPTAFHDYHATVLSVAPGVWCRCVLFFFRPLAPLLSDKIWATQGAVSQWASSVICSARPHHHLLLPLHYKAFHPSTQ